MRWNRFWRTSEGIYVFSGIGENIVKTRSSGRCEDIIETRAVSADAFCACRSRFYYALFVLLDRSSSRSLVKVDFFSFYSNFYSKFFFLVSTRESDFRPWLRGFDRPRYALQRFQFPNHCRFSIIVTARRRFAFNVHNAWRNGCFRDTKRKLKSRNR